MSIFGNLGGILRDFAVTLTGSKAARPPVNCSWTWEARVFILYYTLGRTKTALESIYDWKRDTIRAALEVVVNMVEVGFGKVVCRPSWR